MKNSLRNVVRASAFLKNTVTVNKLPQYLKKVERFEEIKTYVLLMDELIKDIDNHVNKAIL